MHLHSVNVGLPRPVEWGGRTIVTGIFKEPVAGPVALDLVNLDGDRQADLTVHGGPDKAIYAYDLAHYDVWKTQLTRTDWTPGLFGENLTTKGLLDSQVRIGDLFQVGTAQLRAVQPRFPCYKVNVRFNDTGMARRFAQVGRSGIYFRVVKPGVVEAGDSIDLIEAADTDITIQAISQLVLTHKADTRLMDRVLALPHLPVSLKRQFGG